MRIESVEIKKFRTLENIKLAFPNPYTAICGANDSGKTNVIRAIRHLSRDDELFYPRYPEPELSLEEDYTKWCPQASPVEPITMRFELSVDEVRDAGFHRFVVRQLSLGESTGSFRFAVELTYAGESTEVSVGVGEQAFGGLEAQEVLARLKTSKSILFHNSTESVPEVFGSRSGMLSELSSEHESVLADLKKRVNRGLAKITKDREKELEDLLGRLESKYKVSLSLPTLDFQNVPYGVTLTDHKYDVALNDWGSGTKNRTLILLRLFKAKQISEAETSASKATPIIVVEEPESFLHPSAQAEFGKVLSDLANEFGVQVIVTTHSPYLLNIATPAANILLNRSVRYGKRRETVVVKTDGDEWMQPYSHALGLSTDAIVPWRPLLESKGNVMLLVEGAIDKEYFEMLRDPAHGKEQLVIDGEILDYEGTGSLDNSVLLRFIQRLHKRMFVTYDLDAEDKLKKKLENLGLENQKDFLAIGANAPGRKNIEGLLPDSVRASVNQANPDLVDAMASGTPDERRQARRVWKQKLLEEFRTKATPGAEYFGTFYKVARAINKALK